MLLVSIVLHGAPAVSPHPELNNIALGRPYAVSAKPNYGAGAASGWEKRLTDGIYADTSGGGMWGKAESVTWMTRHNRPHFITVDLGEDKPISGASFSTSGTPWGTVPPHLIYVTVSMDGKTFHPAGELIHTTELGDDIYRFAPSPHKYIRFNNVEMRTHGRYVQFIPYGTPNGTLPCDEIEIYEGKPEYLHEAYQGEALSSGTAPVNKRLQIQMNCRHRMRLMDIALQDELKLPRVPETMRAAFEARRTALLAEAKAFVFSGDPESFEARIPVCDVHARQYDLLADIRVASGFQPLTVWTSHRYDRISLTQAPPKSGKYKISVYMATNDCRAGTFNVTNNTGKPLTYSFKLSGAIAREYKPHVVLRYDDANFLGTLLEALVPLQESNGIYSATVPNGMTQQIWIDFSSIARGGGWQEGCITVTANGKEHEIPVTLFIASAKLPSIPTLDCPVWEFAAMRHYVAVTDQNVKGLVEDMKNALIATTFGSGLELPMPDKNGFDADGHLLLQPDTTKFDAWLTLYPDARQYFLYPVWNKFGGFTPGTPQFHNAVKEWAAFMEKHCQKKGLKRHQLRINFLDEPNTPEKIKIVLAFAKAVREATDYISLSANPNRPLKGTDLEKELIQTFDTLQLARRVFNDEPSMAFILANMRPETGLEIISSSTPGDLGPKYFRVNPLICYCKELTGFGFWSYTYQNTMDRRNEYLAISDGSTAPSMITKDGAIATKMTRAIADAHRDYDTFRLMKDQELARKMATEAGIAAEKSDRREGDFVYTSMREIDKTLNQLYKILREQK